MSAELVAKGLYYMTGFAVCSVQQEWIDPLHKYPVKKHHILHL